MKNHISLTINKGFHWHHQNSLYVKGYLYDENNKFYRDENLLSFFNTSNISDLIKKIKQANGCFSLVYQCDNKIILASDRTRSFPLFYYFENNEMFINDDPLNLIRKTKPNSDSINSFLGLGYTLTNHTLYENIRQVAPCEYVVIENNTIDCFYYDNYYSNTIHTNDLTSLKTQLRITLLNSFRRFIDSLQNRNIVVALSGGFDSRLIVSMLRHFNYENVTCITYGRSYNNPELELSKNVAKNLGYKWYFIEYTHELIAKYIFDKPFYDYIKYGANISSIPMLHEFFAVRFLIDNKMISDDSIFTTGHSGDFLGGSQITKYALKNIEQKDIVKKIIDSKVSYNKNFVDVNKIGLSIREIIEETEEGSTKPYQIIENFDYLEKLPKAIFNSSKVFNFFGFEHRFPLWDIELVDFFKNVPLNFKENKMLYDQVINEEFFIPQNISFQNEMQPSPFKIKLQIQKEKIKKLLPSYILNLLAKDFNYTNSRITASFLKDYLLKKNNNKLMQDEKNTNSIILYWYITNLNSLYENI